MDSNIVGTSVTPVSQRVLSLFSLVGKTAIVTGAAAGLGLSIVEALAEAGANVALLYHSNDSAVKEASHVEMKFQVKCRAYKVDVTSAEDIKHVTSEIVNDLDGRLDVFVANSGIAWNEDCALDSRISHYRQIMATDLDSVYYCALAAGKHFRRQAQEQTTIDGKPLENFRMGSFIATASMSGHIVNFPHLQTGYNVAKAGVIHVYKSLAIEWRDFARVNTVSPGFIESGLTGAVSEEIKDSLREKTPLRRIGALHELNGIYLYLASDASTFTTGADVVVDGGYSLW